MNYFKRTIIRINTFYFGIILLVSFSVYGRPTKEMIENLVINDNGLLTINEKLLDDILKDIKKEKNSDSFVDKNNAPIVNDFLEKENDVDLLDFISNQLKTDPQFQKYKDADSGVQISIKDTQTTQSILDNIKYLSPILLDSFFGRSSNSGVSRNVRQLGGFGGGSGLLNSLNPFNLGASLTNSRGGKTTIIFKTIENRIKLRIKFVSFVVTLAAFSSNITIIIANAFGS